jgi:hypothetical protein
VVIDAGNASVPENEGIRHHGIGAGQIRRLTRDGTNMSNGAIINKTTQLIKY